MSYQDEFLEIYRSKISREGSVPLLEWLQKTDFFTAPASSKYHCACRGGLVQHSVSVYRTMMEKHFEQGKDSEESFAICALLHDVCKAQFYKEGFRNVKNDENRPVGEKERLFCGGQLSLRPRREVRIPDRAVPAAEDERSRRHSLAHGWL